MNIAIIIAGGSGLRMNQDIPKQFINVFDKPVIIYTLEAFQQHPDIDEILVVCLEGWHEILRAYAKQFNISKLKNVVLGGNTGQESIQNGIFTLDKEGYSADDTVLIHDAIRPMISPEMISDCIAKCRVHGNAVVSLPTLETVMRTYDKVKSTESIPRDTIMRVQTPQAYKLNDMVSLYNEAITKGITNSVYTNTLMIELGREVYFAIGSEKNIKLTTTDDIELFKLLLKSKKDEWIK